MLNKRKVEPTQKVHDRQTVDILRNTVAVPAIVDDPLERGAQIVVTRAIRDDILAEMLSRKEIDHAQYLAGREYEECAEAAEIGNVQAMDPAKAKVDGGRIGSSDLSNRQINAVRELEEIDSVLGARGTAMVRFVLLSKRPFSALGLTKHGTAQARTKFFTYLEIMAQHWGFAGKNIPIPP